MKIGIDVSLKTCREEGYLIMEFSPKTLFAKKILNPDLPVRFYKYIPDYLADSKFEKPCLDVWVSANNLWELYKENSKEIDSYSGVEKEREFPTNRYELLELASDIDGYKGLE